MNSIIQGITIQGESNMLIISEIHDLIAKLNPLRVEGKSIGFVPTMGALHEGHLSLISKAHEENDIVVVSIFVNPTQFNNPEDLKNYPRTPEEDQRMLKESHTDFLFSPSVAEIYDKKTPELAALFLGSIADVMEGEHRPGHFAGVVQIVSKLFDIVKPDKAYFGEKDFQQLAIIRYMVNKLNYQVQIIPCKTVREKNGLAMSSRNLRLSETGREEASLIYKTLLFVKDNYHKYSPSELKSKAIEMINSNNKLEVEYLEIADEETLQSVSNWNESKSVRCFTAVFCEGIRLIDNIKVI